VEDGYTNVGDKAGGGCSWTLSVAKPLAAVDRGAGWVCIESSLRIHPGAAVILLYRLLPQTGEGYSNSLDH